MALRSPRLLSLPILGAALAVIISGGLRAPLAKADDPKADPKDDALPKEAKLRLGSTVPSIRETIPLPPDCTRAITRESSGEGVVLNLITGRKVVRPPENVATSFAKPVAVSGDGQRAANRVMDGIVVWDTANGKELRMVSTGVPISKFISLEMRASLSWDGKVLAYSTKDRGQAKDAKGEVVVWDVEKDAAIARIVIPTPIAQPVLSGDAKILVTTTTQRPGNKVTEISQTIQVWDVGTQKELAQVKAGELPTTVILSAALSNCGRPGPGNRCRSRWRRSPSSRSDLHWHSPPTGRSSRPSGNSRLCVAGTWQTGA
jgi:hypothetical protein